MYEKNTCTLGMSLKIYVPYMANIKKNKIMKVLITTIS